MILPFDRLSPEATRTRALLLLILPLLLVSCQSARLSPPPFPSAVASVNGTIITRVEVAAELGSSHPGRLSATTAASAARQLALHKCILRELIRQRASRLGIACSRAELDTAAAILADASARPYKTVYAHPLLSRLVARASRPSAHEVRSYYKKNKHLFTIPESAHIRHLLVHVPRTARAAVSEAARRRIEGLRRELQDGGDFAQLARTHSDCESAEAGGNLGTVSPNSSLPPALLKAAFTQPLHTVGRVIRSDSGYHIAQVLARRPAGAIPFEDVKTTLATGLDGERQQQHIRKFLDDLWESASVVKFASE